MVKIYAVALAIAVVALVVVILGGTLADNLGRGERDPARVIGRRGRMVIGGLAGFGLAGLSAEFSTLDLGWPAALLVGLAGAAAGALWARFASGRESESDAGPV